MVTSSPVNTVERRVCSRGRVDRQQEKSQHFLHHALNGGVHPCKRHVFRRLDSLFDDATQQLPALTVRVTPKQTPPFRAAAADATPPSAASARACLKGRLGALLSNAALEQLPIRPPTPPVKRIPPGTMQPSEALSACLSNQLSMASPTATSEQRMQSRVHLLATHPTPTNYRDQNSYTC